MQLRTLHVYQADSVTAWNVRFLTASLAVQIIPDIDERLTLSHIGTPKSHARFLRRKRGTYGPRNLLTMAGALPKAVKPLENMYCCGDSVFPGVGTPAVAASGMWVANTIMPVQAHLEMMRDVKL
jgi:phytoene dehydrogenase-like protein